MNTTVFASDYAKLDSNVITGGGTDDTAALQSLLDKALEWGRLKLVMDGAALVRGLVVHSNTTIECMNRGCGFYLADGSDCAVLRNSNPGYGEIHTHNISLIGGTYNQNCLHQAHDVACDDATLTSDSPDNKGERHWIVGLEFIGVENLDVRGLVVRDQRTFAFTVGNFRHVNIENTFIELEHEIPFGNQDGFHFWGPGQFLTLRNVGGKTEDDFMNVGPDERDGVSSITDVLIDGVFLDHAWQGIRLLSRGTGLLDRVMVKNVTGTYKLFGFYINPWFITETNGKFGNITFENIDLRPDNDGVSEEYCKTHPRFLFSIGGDMESLTFRNISWYHANNNWNIFQIGYPYHDTRRAFVTTPRIRRMLIDGLTVLEDKAEPTEYMILRGRVDRLTVRDAELIGSHKESVLLKVLDDGDIGRLTVDRVDAENMHCVLDLSRGRTEQAVFFDVWTKNVAKFCKGNCPTVGEISALEE